MSLAALPQLHEAAGMHLDGCHNRKLLNEGPQSDANAAGHYQLLGAYLHTHMRSWLQAC